MIHMILYGIGIMYTPGPVNIMGFNLGLNKKLKHSLGFFSGVSFAMFLLFIIFGYSGEKLVQRDYLLYISILGCCYITYLAYKIFTSTTDLSNDGNTKYLTFKDGFIMQFFNPKAILVALPITTIWFPSYSITGIHIALVSLLFMLLVFGAPTMYCLIGTYFSSLLTNKNILFWTNKLMALLLLYVAFTIFRDHIYYVVKGINTL